MGARSHPSASDAGFRVNDPLPKRRHRRGDRHRSRRPRLAGASCQPFFFVWYSPPTVVVGTSDSISSFMSKSESTGIQPLDNLDHRRRAIQSDRAVSLANDLVPRRPQFSCG